MMIYLEERMPDQPIGRDELFMRLRECDIGAQAIALLEQTEELLREQQALAMAMTAEADALRERLERLRTVVGMSYFDQFLRSVHALAVSRANLIPDEALRSPDDWFWHMGRLVGEIKGALDERDVWRAQRACVTAAGALFNWHCALGGLDVRETPNQSDLTDIVDAAFEVAEETAG